MKTEDSKAIDDGGIGELLPIPPQDGEDPYDEAEAWKDSVIDNAFVYDDELGRNRRRTAFEIVQLFGMGADDVLEEYFLGESD